MCFFEAFRVVLAQPVDLNQRRHRMDGSACGFVDFVAQFRVAQLPGLVLSAVISPGDGIAKGNTVLVYRKQAVHRRAEAYRQYPVAVGMNFFIQQVFHHIQHGNKHLVRVLLAVVGLYVKSRVGSF